MTSQDDLARPWFQPSVPPTGHPDPGPQQRPAGGRPTTGPMTTRVAGELSLDEVSAPTPRPPGRDAAPERVEVTQPYIPAISEHAPDFAKRPPSPGSGASTRNSAGGSHGRASGSVPGAFGGAASNGSSAAIDVGYGPRAKEPVERLPLMSEIAAADPAAAEAPDAQGALTQPGDFTPAGDFAPGAGAPTGTQFAPAPPPSPAQPTAPQAPAAAQPATERHAPAKPPKKRSLARRVVRRIIGPDLLRKDPPK